MPSLDIPLKEVMVKVEQRLSRSPVTQERHKKAFLTLGENRILFWGNNSQLVFVKTKPSYNPKNFNFEFPLLLPVFKELLLAVKSITPVTVDEPLLEYMTCLEDRTDIFNRIKKQKDAEGITIQNVGLKNTTLYPHQTVASHINELYPRILCLDEMGLGKTIVAIRTALYRFKISKNKRCLIICPNSIKTTVWAKEIEQRTNFGYCVPSGGKAKREKTIQKFLSLNQDNPAYHFLIINFEMTYKYIDLLKKFTDEQMLVIDEAHYMKTYNSQRTKGIFKLEPKYLISMTGTPFDNRIEDIYTLAEYVAPIIFGGSFVRFKAEYCIEESIYAKSPEGPVQRKVIAGYKNLGVCRS
ncbi:MAG: DEAD/DEAH box helicase family protein [bacterium]|nr:DEAD/DEAH box helicase family protein [bacterium]